jgi:hypothetical protein
LSEEWDGALLMIRRNGKVEEKRCGANITKQSFF